MRFDDNDLLKLDAKTQAGLARLLTDLCGENVMVGCGTNSNAPCEQCQRCINWSVLTSRLKLATLSLEDLNDILLLADQFPLGAAFFEFFLSQGKGTISFQELNDGIIRFRGYALLKFGNVRFAYRTLFKLSREELSGRLGRWHADTTGLKKEYSERRDSVALPREIPAEKTWLLGYIAKSDADRDFATYAAMACLAGVDTEANLLQDFSSGQRELYGPQKEALETQTAWKSQFKTLGDIRSKINELSELIRDVRRQGWRNTSHYLASDCMDVYVATSMRERWEFEDIHNVVNTIFADHRLANLKLRYFDPTQSFLDNRVDKGLVEALMLKRSSCTVYLIQETDTFGKDSELATTLAQGKPVIAYLPKINIKKASETAALRPVSYLQKRLPQLAAEGKIASQYLSEVFRFLETVSAFQPYYRIVGDEENEFLERHKLAQVKRTMCDVLAEAEKKLFDSRAETLQRRHPLALQVDLGSGVANGVLVVRTEQDCAELLSRLLTNDCEFRFESVREPGITSLVENISESPFRVVTHNKTLTNAFWSLYNLG
jgi:hypothetical protein